MRLHIGRYQRWMYHRRVWFVVFLILQAIILFIGLALLTRFMPYLYLINLVLAFLLSLYIVNQDRLNPSFRIGWLVLMCLFPILGALVYLFITLNPRPRGIANRIQSNIEDTRPWIRQDPEVMVALRETDRQDYGLARYLSNEGPFPSYRHTDTDYYGDGATGFDALLEDIKQAKSFVFMEYFIISPGKLLDRLVQVLKERAAAGVEVRIIYDGYNHVTKLDTSFPEEMKELGIEAHPFARLHPFLSTEQNNRDHRKITVIDGLVAYTGGLNLADEYINVIQPYGHWKDAMLRVEGEGVRSLLAMFLQMWNISEPENPTEDMAPYFAKITPLSPDEGADPGFMAPYGDTPNAGLDFGKTVYISILNSATDYVYITSPYLILDDPMRAALTYAARRGVDVQLILPHVPDKRIPFLVCRTYYPLLLKAGVKIYEYEPGFMHAKLFVSDDRVATVGSFNLDYRSFHLHYEVGVWLSGCTCIQSIKDDFLATRARCIHIEEDFYPALPWIERAGGRVLRLFAPLM